jgi:putative ABC transport system substrate-binding protein
MRRRDFVKAAAASAATWPLAARAQAIPVIGFLAQGTPDEGAALLSAVRKGLGEANLVEGKDFTSEFRWAQNDAVRLPGLAVELVQRRVAIIVVLDTQTAARAAKLATNEIPIVFSFGADPVKAGLVESLNRPGGNITGISTMSLDLGAKWVGLLHELLPSARRFAILVNIETADAARSLITSVQEGALPTGLQTEIVFASTASELEPTLAGLGARAQALIVHPDVLFLRNREPLAALATREKLATISTVQGFAPAGGLLSYGSDFVEAHHQAGLYVARILKGEKPGDLPVQRATKFNLVINLKTAKAIGLDIPAMFQARADEVIE